MVLLAQEDHLLASRREAGLGRVLDSGRHGVPKCWAGDRPPHGPPTLAPARMLHGSWPEPLLIGSRQGHQHRPRTALDDADAALCAGVIVGLEARRPGDHDLLLREVASHARPRKLRGAIRMDAEDRLPLELEPDRRHHGVQRPDALLSRLALQQNGEIPHLRLRVVRLHAGVAISSAAAGPGAAGADLGKRHGVAIRHGRPRVRDVAALLRHLGWRQHLVRAEQEVPRPPGHVLLQRTRPSPRRMGAAQVSRKLPSWPGRRVQAVVRAHAPCGEPAIAALHHEGGVPVCSVLRQLRQRDCGPDRLGHHGATARQAHSSAKLPQHLSIVLRDVDAALHALQLQTSVVWQPQRASLRRPLEPEPALLDVDPQREERLKRGIGLDVHHVVFSHPGLHAPRRRLEIDAPRLDPRVTPHRDRAQLVRGARVGEQHPLAANFHQARHGYRRARACRRSRRCRPSVQPPGVRVHGRDGQRSARRSLACQSLDRRCHHSAELTLLRRRLRLRTSAAWVRSRGC